MSYGYQFKFYDPTLICQPEKVVRLVQGMLKANARITDYLIDGRRYLVKGGAAPDPAQVVSAAGHCAVGLLATTAGGDLELFFQAYPPEAKGAQVTLAVEEEALEENPRTASEVLLQFARLVNLHLSPRFAWCGHELLLQRLEPLLAFNQIKTLAWANLFSPRMLKQVGRERVQSAPSYQTQSFKQGILYLLGPDPATPIDGALAGQLGSYFPGCQIRDR